MMRFPLRESPPLFLALLLLLCAPTLAAQDAPPSPEEVLGYSIGRHFTDYAGIREYARALAAASPLIEYRPYGTTPERRELIQLVIARADHLQRLDAILAANAELTLPGTTQARAREIAATNPAVIYFSYGVHGNESSSPEAALWTAWDLARGAPEVAGVLDSVVVILDPAANPDGRDRYVQWFRSVVGAQPNPSRQAREHREPWPGGRFNHYLFDLNRDWAWATQPETRARLATWNRWNPQVKVDFHEMGYERSYFFFPAAEPINPIYPEHVLAWGRRFGDANARAFDAAGWPYFTGESYDLFYPGYGDSWPSLTGAVGMTYEQAGGGSAGLAIERAAGDTLTLAHRAQQHRVAGHATLRTAAAGKSMLLLDFAAFHRTAGQGHPDILLVPGDDPARAEALVEHLRVQGIEVERAAQAFRAANARPYPAFGRRAHFPAGTYLVRARQPRGRLAATLLQPETELRAEYSYDISAWSLPYAYGVEAHQGSSVPGAAWAPVRGAEVPGTATVPAAYGYLLSPGDDSAAGVVRFLQAGGRARVLSRASTFQGRRWPAGSWFIPAFGNEGVQERVTAAGLATLATPVQSGRSEEGIDLGSDRAPPVRLPRVAVLSGEGVSPTSFGAHWFFLEQRLGLPFDALLTGDIARADLTRYDVIVIPEASSTLLEERTRELLRAWIQRGGRLVAVGGGAEAAAPLAEVEVRPANVAAGDTADARRRLLRGREERERADWETQVPGTILPARLDPAHPLAWGAGTDGDAEQLFVLHAGDRVFEPAADVEAVAYFRADLPRISGIISPENLRRLQQGAWLVTRPMGRGSVVLFAGDPLFRMFWRATHPLYVNALLLGPGM
ncbi:M14 family metallopeptidase [soil metagenome]